MKYSLFIAIILLVAYSCKKNSTNPTTTEILVSSKWNFSKLLLESPLGATPADITLATLKLCELDDIIEFKQGGAYSCSENIDVCLNSNNNLFFNLNGGSWTLSSGDSLLTIQLGLSSQSFRFRKISTSTVELYQDQKNYLNENVRYSYILIAVN